MEIDILTNERIYTVSQLSKSAGISTRTLHYYDQIGLLKPNRRKDNGFREYCYEQVIRLQQILIYRELDFSIEKIRDLLTSDQYDILKALNDQNSMLLKRINQTQLMIDSIEVTMNSIRGKINKDIMFEGIPKEKVERWDRVQQAKYGKGFSELNLKLFGNLSEEEAKRYGEVSDIFCNEYAMLLEFAADSSKVQEHVMKHYRIMNSFLYSTHDEFKGIGYNGYLQFASQVLNDEVTFEYHEYYRTGFAKHLNKAMIYFSEHTLKGNVDELRKNSKI